MPNHLFLVIRGLLQRWVLSTASLMTITQIVHIFYPWTHTNICMYTWMKNLDFRSNWTHVYPCSRTTELNMKDNLLVICILFLASSACSGPFRKWLPGSYVTSILDEKTEQKLFYLSKNTPNNLDNCILNSFANSFKLKWPFWSWISKEISEYSLIEALLKISTLLWR